MATHYQSQNLWGLKFNCLDYILLNAERQTSFNPNAMDIERKLFTSAINIAICLPHQPPKMIGHHCSSSSSHVSLSYSQKHAALDFNGIPSVSQTYLLHNQR